jgi:hypothetical protein
MDFVLLTPGRLLALQLLAVNAFSSLRQLFQKQQKPQTTNNGQHQNKTPALVTHMAMTHRTGSRIPATSRS